MAPVLTCRYSGALCPVFPLQIHMVGTSIRVNGHSLQRCPQSHAAILLLCCSVSPTLHHLVCLLCLLVTSRNRSIHFSLFYPMLNLFSATHVTRDSVCSRVSIVVVTLLCHVTYYHMLTDYDS